MGEVWRRRWLQRLPGPIRHRLHPTPKSKNLTKAFNAPRTARRYQASCTSRQSEKEEEEDVAHVAQCDTAEDDRASSKDIRYAAYLARKEQQKIQQLKRRNRQLSIQHWKGHRANINRLGRGRCGGLLMQEITYEVEREDQCQEQLWNTEATPGVADECGLHGECSCAAERHGLCNYAHQGEVVPTSLKSWRRRSLRCWWLKQLRVAVGTQVELVGWSLSNPASPQAMRPGSTSETFTECKVGPLVGNPNAINCTDAAIVPAGCQGTIKGLLPAGGVIVEFHRLQTKRGSLWRIPQRLWQIPQELLYTLRSCVKLSPGDLIRSREAPWQKGVVVSHPAETVISHREQGHNVSHAAKTVLLRWDGETSVRACAQHAVKPLRGVVQTFELGEALKVRKNAPVPRNYVSLEGQHRGPLFKGHWDEHVGTSVKVIDVPEPGLVRICPDHVFSLVSRDSEAFTVPVSAVRRVQTEWHILTPHVHRTSSGYLVVNFTNMNGETVASSELALSALQPLLPRRFWGEVANAAGVPESHIAVVLLDGRFFKGNEIHRVDAIEDLVG